MKDTNSLAHTKRNRKDSVVAKSFLQSKNTEYIICSEV